MSIRWVRQALTAVLLVAAGVLFFNEVFSISSDRSRPAPRADAAPSPAPTFSFVRATKPIARGSIIRATDIQLEESSSAPTAGTLSSAQSATDRIAIRDIAASELLSETNTAATPDGTSLSQVIPQGLRAIALRVNEDSSVANLIRPGDRVDVLVVSNSRTAPSAGRVFPPAQAMTILQNIPVLAVGGVTVVAEKSSKAPARTVALAVTPKQAAMVALIHAVGTEYLSLRPADDEGETELPPVSTDDLHPNPPVPQRPTVAAAAAAPAAQPRQRTRTIEVIAGKSDNVSRVNLAESQ